MPVAEVDDRKLVEQLAICNSIDELVDRFESDWHPDKVAAIQALVDGADETIRESLLTELVLVDAERCRANKLSRSKDFYLHHLPGYGMLLESLDFDALEAPQSIVPAPVRGQLLAGRYEYCERVGRGATGEVWRALDHQLGRYVAVKLANRIVLNELELQRFLRESRAGAQLRHLNIVRVIDAGFEGTLPYIVAEYIEGTNLKEWLNNHQASPRRAAEICLALCEGLDYAHEHGIVHRDVKPANILIDGTGHVYITDFGLAKWHNDAADLTVTGQLLGTAYYMSPEQAAGQASKVDRRTDVYALGVILYELLVGRCPHTGDLISVGYDIRYKRPEPPRSINHNVPVALEAICLKALEKDPAKRYPTCRELAADLDRYLNNRPVLARRRPALLSLLEWSKQYWLVGAAALVLVVVAALLVAHGQLAKENNLLRGFQSVRINTVPEGAKIAFLPLTEGGAPSQTVRYLAEGTAPIHLEVPAGDYWVVAVLEDGRFHEVLRHVPRRDERVVLHESYPHRFCRRLEDGSWELPAITIPEAHVTHEMSWVEGDRFFLAGIPDSRVVPQHAEPVADFYLDNKEFTLGELKKTCERIPPRFAQEGLTNSSAITVSYDQAVAYAELQGKRLPTEFEYELAATNRGTTLFPWGDEAPSNFVRSSFQDKDDPQFDRLRSIPLVERLCTGVAEWTGSHFMPYRTYAIDPKVTETHHLRVVRGLPTKVTGEFTYANPHERSGYHRIDINSHVGFRCARSATSPVSYEEFAE